MSSFAPKDGDHGVIGSRGDDICAAEALLALSASSGTIGSSSTNGSSSSETLLGSLDFTEDGKTIKSPSCIIVELSGSLGTIKYVDDDLKIHNGDVVVLRSTKEDATAVVFYREKDSDVRAYKYGAYTKCILAPITSNGSIIAELWIGRAPSHNSCASKDVRTMYVRMLCGNEMFPVQSSVVPGTQALEPTGYWVFHWDKTAKRV